MHTRTAQPKNTALAGIPVVVARVLLEIVGVGVVDVAVARPMAHGAE